MLFRSQSAAGILQLMTVRSHDQYNTTIYGMNDRYRGVFGERRVVFINAEDLQTMGMQADQWVDIESLCDDGIKRVAERFMLVAYNIPRGCLASYFPETNCLVPLSFVVQMAPVSVNGFGVREATFGVYFTRLGLPLESALAVSLIGAVLIMVFSLTGAVAYLTAPKVEG